MFTETSTGLEDSLNQRKVGFFFPTEMRKNAVIM